MAFQPLTGTDWIAKGGVSSLISTRLICITLMESYKNSSLEELRAEYYAENVKSTTPGKKNPFGNSSVCGENFPSNGAELLAENFEDAFKNQRFSDVILKAGDAEFRAHKIILSTRSKVFERMFDSKMKESEENVVNLAEMEPSTAEDMLRYIYTGKIREQPSIDRATDLYIVADRYELPELKQVCKDFLLNHISPDSVCDVAVLASMHSDEDLDKETKRIIRNDLRTVMKSGKWLSLSKKNPAFYLEILQEAITDDSDFSELREEYCAENLISTTTGRENTFLNPPAFGVPIGAMLLAENFEDAFKNPKFSDVIVKAGDAEFPAHKIILSTRSKVFESKMKESEENVVNLAEMEPSAAEDMLSYIYTGKIREQPSIERVTDLYIVGDRYDLPELKQGCKDFLLNHISPDSVCDVAVLASMHRDEDLDKATKRIIRNDLQAVMKSGKWLTSSKKNPAFYLEILQEAMTDDKYSINKRSHFISEEKKEETPGSFSFGTPQTEAVNSFQTDFNINTPPSFNFGATSIPAASFHFAAISQSSAPRKYKKCVRRVLRKLD